MRVWVAVITIQWRSPVIPILVEPVRHPIVVVGPEIVVVIPDVVIPDVAGRQDKEQAQGQQGQQQTSIHDFPSRCEGKSSKGKIAPSS
jgi:hypothetical protein